jgi:hemerythrin
MSTVSLESKQSWKKQYVLDIPSIDKQHMYFFKLFDKVNIFERKELDYEEINSYISELEEYTRFHFQTEEALMREAEYANYDLHVQQHKLFIDRITEFKIDYGYKNLLLIEKIVTFMRKWLIVHISETDRQYVSTVKQMLEANNHLAD